MRNILVKLLVMEFKLTKRDKFIGVIWLLYKAYLEKMLRIIVFMHIKPALSWESRVVRLGIEKFHK
jgi:ABC-type polysaccharide/polyol phosphate export permease